MADPTPEVVNNHDIAFLNDKITRFAYEVFKSQSSSLTGIGTFDSTRLNQYLDSLDISLDHFSANPQLDLPETSPFSWTIQPFPAVANVESDEVDHVLRLLRLSREELINSQSARASAGLISFDLTRIKALVTKCRNFLTQYVEKSNPHDLPESSPGTASSGAGLTGINPK